MIERTFIQRLEVGKIYGVNVDQIPLVDFFLLVEDLMNRSNNVDSNTNEDF